MYADLDSLVLSGQLFSASRSSSPARAPSPGAKWPNSDYSGDEDNGSEHSDSPKLPPGVSAKAPEEQVPQSIGMGPGRTGVKGVIRDRAEAIAQEKARRAQEIAELNKRMERANLGGLTYREEEELKRRENGETSKGAMGKFGHLREVGKAGYVGAVEERDAWVVVHIYDASLERCATLDQTLSSLARSNPQTKFIRTRAAAIGFASLSSDSGPSNSRAKDSEYIIREGEYFAEDDDEYSDEDDVDTDMLPTLLAYRGGDLVHTWVRVDWEIDKESLGAFLMKHNVIPKSSAVLDSDEEEESDVDF